MTRIDSLLRGAAIAALALLAACSGTTDFTVSKTFDVVSVGGQAYSFTKDVDLQADAPDAWKHRDKIKKLELVGIDGTITAVTAGSGTTGSGSLVLRPEGGTGATDVTVGSFQNEPVVANHSLGIALDAAAIRVIEDALHGSGRFTVLLTGTTVASAAFTVRGDLHLKLTYKVP